MSALLTYPHVLERIRALWGHPERETYLNSIMISDRDHRAGFIPEAWVEMRRILDVHRLLYGIKHEHFPPFRFSPMLSHA